MSSEDGVMLQVADFPDYFINQQHPDDYIITSNYICELIYHRLIDHNKLILRISFKIAEGMFFPVTFICDTGAPGFIYINSITRRLLSRRIQEDMLENNFIKIDEKFFQVKPSPSNHPDTNILGLRMLSHLGITIDYDNFSFSRLPEYF